MLSYLDIKNLKPKDKTYTVTDAPGLYLRVWPSGKKVWIINKSINGKRVVKQLGAWPDLPAKDARALWEVCVNEGKAEATGAFTFGGIYRDWIELKKTQIKNWKDIDERISKYLLPDFDSMALAGISPPALIKVLNEKLGARGKFETVKRVCGYVKEMEIFAVNSGRINMLRFQGIDKVFPKPSSKMQHRPSIEPSKLPEVLKALHAASITAPGTWDAVLIGFYTLLRPAEYCAMEWSWIDEVTKIVTVPAEVMKMKRPHTVPITPQLMTIFERRPRVNPFVLASPGVRDSHISTAAAELFFRRHGLRDILVPHGIRAIGRTWMAENGIDDKVAELCIAHSVGTQTVQAYDRADLLEQRREAMSRWCSFVESCLK
ncbi:MAG: tyrosine-type recombinase/integrase [Succinatimonas hippei]|nr:tyrosine-type recombinase/integrase [Succinatimonas hippei]